MSKKPSFLKYHANFCKNSLFTFCRCICEACAFLCRFANFCGRKAGSVRISCFSLATCGIFADLKNKEHLHVNETHLISNHQQPVLKIKLVQLILYEKSGFALTRSVQQCKRQTRVSKKSRADKHPSCNITQNMFCSM